MAVALPILPPVPSFDGLPETGCAAKVFIKIEMNWAADNSLRQSNSVIFFFAGYNLIVSQGGRLTLRGFLRAHPPLSIC